MRWQPTGKDEDLNRVALELTRALFDDTDVEPREGLYLDDVRFEINEFESDMQFLRRSTRRGESKAFPMQRAGDGRLVPIALRHLLSTFRLSDQQGSRSAIEIEYVSPGSAREQFRDRVTECLVARLRGVSAFLGSQSGHAPGFTFNVPSLYAAVSMPVVGFRIDVATTTSNVRIHSSLLIRRSWSYFGFYTGKPVVGSLMGGLYEFGVDGPGFPYIHPDPGSFDIPVHTVSPRLTL